MSAPTRVRRPGRLIAIAVGVVVVTAGGLLVTTAIARTSRHLAYHDEFCFGEWCVTPTYYEPGNGTEQVGVHVRSTAMAVAQRPDHPQAWLVQPSGMQTGGPQADLDRQIGPAESYDATLVFHAPSSGSCPRLLMSEGAWPSFLGLGYAESPFTERVEWPLCSP